MRTLVPDQQDLWTLGICISSKSLVSHSLFFIQFWLFVQTNPTKTSQSRVSEHLYRDVCQTSAQLWLTTSKQTIVITHDKRFWPFPTVVPLTRNIWAARLLLAWLMDSGLGSNSLCSPVNVTFRESCQTFVISVKKLQPWHTWASRVERKGV